MIVTIELPDFAEMDDDEVAGHCLTRMLDGCWSRQTRALLKQFDTELLDLNDNWAETWALWKCPACQRDKPLIARKTDHRVLLCRLEEHHDHLRDHVEKLLIANRQEESDEVSWRRSPARLAAMDLCERFTPTIICSDCNQADAKAKAGIATMDPAFSFSPDEIARFIEPAPNQPHNVIVEKAAALWEELRADFEERLDFAGRMASRIARGKHDKERHREGVINRDVRRELQMLSSLVSEAGGSSLRSLNLAGDLSNRSRRTDGTASAVKATRRRAAITPTRQDLEAFTATVRPGLWTRASEDWTCCSCGRAKFEVLRKTNKGRWTGNIHRIDTFTEERDRQNIGRRTTNEPYEVIFGGHEPLLICQDCRAIITEAVTLLPGTATDAFPLDVLKELVGTPEAHVAHIMDRDAIRHAVRMNTVWADGAAAYWAHASEAKSALCELTVLRSYPPERHRAIMDDIFLEWHREQHFAVERDRPYYEWLIEEGRRFAALEIRDMKLLMAS